MARKKHPAAVSSPGIAAKRRIEAIKDPVEKAFYVSVINAEAYLRLERDLLEIVAKRGTAARKFAEEDLHELLEPFCRACFTECERSFRQEGDDSFLAHVQAEAERLKKQLDECNLNAMKQVTALKTGLHEDGEYGEDTVQFYEPLQHLEPSTRELVLRICADKVGQIECGIAPNALVTAICEAAMKAPKKKIAHGDDADMDAEDKVDELLDELEELKGHMQSVEQKARSAQALKEAAEDQARDVARKLNEVKAECAQLQEQADALRLEASSLRLEVGRRCSELEEAKQAVQTAEEKVVDAAKVEADLREIIDETTKANAALREEVETSRSAADRMKRLEVELKEAAAEAAEARRQAEEVEASRNQLQMKSLKLEQEAEELRGELEELKRKAQTVRTCGTQSAIAGNQIDHLVTENKRLKVALEEVRAKLGDLMTECKRKGISADQMDVIAETCGLKTLMKAKSVFEKLYEDALQRVDRLEKLRNKYKHEKDRSLGAGRQTQTTQNQQPVQLTENSARGLFSDPQSEILEAVQQGTINEEWLSPPVPSSPLMCARNSAPHTKSSPLRNAVSIAAALDPARGATILQREQALRAQAGVHSPARTEVLPQPPQPPDANAVARDSRPGHRVGSLMSPSSTVTSPSAHAAVGVARTGVFSAAVAAENSSTGRDVSFAPPARDVGSATGNELARRLSASTSLPSLGHPRVNNSLWCQKRDGASNGQTFVARQGLSNLLGGRENGWR